MLLKKENAILVCLTILCVIAITACLYILKPILIPFIFSIFLFFALDPIIGYLESKAKMPRALAITTTLLLLVLVITFFTLMLGISVRGLITSSDVYQLKLLKLTDHLAMLAQSYGVEVDLTVIKQYLLELPFMNWLKNVSGGLVGVVGNLVLILIFTLFFILGRKKGKKEADGFLDTAVRRQITRYITTKVFTSALTGVLVAIILSIFQVQLALMFGTLTFLLNFIPNVGSIIATLLPLPIIFLQFGLSWVMLFALAIPAVVQFAIGNILDPRLMGKNLGLHPITILLSLLFWGFIWGVPGMFLSVPITAVLKLILEQYPNTEGLADILEGDISLSTYLSPSDDNKTD